MRSSSKEGDHEGARKPPCCATSGSEKFLNMACKRAHPVRESRHEKTRERVAMRVAQSDTAEETEATLWTEQT
eukprot:CAMPEP_0116033108 /NCGR_PEP_ID=MMETSP0321-20121206/18735_1 /TAXON_ID=163516 /ORGANISM="Leptocylindrus danicus var. danicus, Strain B650" /LENGTH=72 /DNA_ID=CAMNT_0003509005 /DNA_START=152 /DNA_END=366 /DNA_ORIENTATION=-